MKIKSLIIMSLSCIVISAFAAKPASSVKKIYDNPKKPIVVTKNNATVTIKLPSNATTGYSWFLDEYNHKLIKAVSAKYVPPKIMIAGAPGYMLWTFKLKKAAFVVPQITKVELIYARAWDLKDSADKSIVFVTQ